MREGRAPHARDSLVLACLTIFSIEFVRGGEGRDGLLQCRLVDRYNGRHSSLTSVSDNDRMREGAAAYLNPSHVVVGDGERHSIAAWSRAANGETREPIESRISGAFRDIQGSVGCEPVLASPTLLDSRLPPH